MIKYAKVELLHITENSDQLIEKAGRTCYKSEDKITDDSTAKFVEKILKNKHLSVIEHCTATFRISNISRACSHQLVRHRLASYSQQSQRYVPESQFDYIIPPSIIALGNDTIKEFDNHMSKISESYAVLREYGILKEDARYIFPNATSTEIVMTMNFRTWLHFLEERLSKGAQWEIKTMALCIYEQLRTHSKCFDQNDDIYVKMLDAKRAIHPIQIFVYPSQNITYGQIGGTEQDVI
jgi:thymidylate synthase (FAD)